MRMGMGMGMGMRMRMRMRMGKGQCEENPWLLSSAKASLDSIREEIPGCRLLRRLPPG